MPTKPIPIRPAQASGYEQLAGAGQESINIVQDGAGAVTRRPCLVASSRTSVSAGSSSVIGLRVLPNDDVVAMVGDCPGSYDVVRMLGSSNNTLATFTCTSRPVFVETEAILAWADGRRPNRIVFDGFAVGPLGGQPPAASHLVANSLRLLANDVGTDVTHVNYSNPASGSSFIPHEEWNTTTANGTASFFSAEANPDPVMALGANANEIAVFKKRICSVFGPDATSVFVPISTRDIGISAPNSVVNDDHMFAWLDDRRRVVYSDMRQVTPISGPIQATLDGMSRVDDAFGYRFHHGAVDALVWTFPTDGRTFVFQKEVGWGQWQASGSAWSRFPVESHYLVPETRENLVGLSDGQVVELKTGVDTDLGESVHSYVRTGFQSHGTDALKHCQAVRVAFKRGDGTSPEGRIGISWRDDQGDFEGPIFVGVGLEGDEEIVEELRGLGTYRRRQWKFSFHGPETLSLAGVEEQFEVLQQ